MSVRVLVLCGDQWHPAADVRLGFNALSDARFDFDYAVDCGQGAVALLREYSVVIVVKVNHRSASDQSPWLTVTTQSAVRDFVSHGGGLFLIHGGTCYKDLPEMCGVAGGAFLKHPDECPVTVEPMSGHQMTAGVNRFTERDEQYFVELNAADAKVFLFSRSQHGMQPAGWTRTVGNGRVCVLTSGHNRAVWMHPEFEKLLRNGLIWLSRLA
jgi:type 1 glutamine amidotransferase